MSNAKPMSYADRAERYLRQRGIPHDPSRMSIHKLTAPQRRRAIRKERRGWRKLAEASRA